ncbi:uncharacterized protein LOC134650378 [Cydia amplana]|uniref:uncharacterized protein LOC134650378 n=1 Tax=Cydia amplana TaxID=1869771 RepID=UPI002FE5E38E
MRILSRNDLFAIIERSDSSTFNEKLQFMEHELLNQYTENDHNIPDIKHKLSQIKHQFKQKWSAARNTKARFLDNNVEWLKGCISLPKAGISPGRPQKTFLELSERSKRRKTEELRSLNTDELTFATQMKLRETGKLEASKVVKDLTKSPRRAKKYITALKKNTVTCEDDQEKLNNLTHLRALFMYTEAGLTQAQYEIVRETNPSYYPCYSILQKCKKECYPEIHRVTETCAEA